MTSKGTAPPPKSAAPPPKKWHCYWPFGHNNTKSNQCGSVLIVYHVRLRKIDKSTQTLVNKAMIDILAVKRLVASTRDNSCINLETGRRIKWSEAKEKRMWFDKTLQICCPHDSDEKQWKRYRKQLLTPSKVIVQQRDDPFDYFDWAEDQRRKNVLRKNGGNDYIWCPKKSLVSVVPRLKTN